MSSCKRRALPIDCIIICSDLNESAKITLKMALIETPVDNVPKLLKEGATKEEGETIKKELETAGAKVTIK